MAEQASAHAGGSSSRTVPAEQASSQGPAIGTVDDAVSLIRSIEGTPETLSPVDYSAVLTHIRDVLLPALHKLYHAQKGKHQRIFTQALQGGIDPLTMLDPARNTLGYAYILACRAKLATNVESAQLLVGYIDSFARYFQPAQLVGAGEIVTALARSIADIGQVLANPIGALTSLVRLFDGFRSVQRSRNNLSTLHPIVVYQCLRARHYDAAVDWVLKYDVISADETSTPLTYTDVIEHFYYAGLVWARVNSLEKACEYLQLCVTSPSHQVSAIQVDAYKKLLLIQLLKDGKTSPLPRYTSQAISRAIRGKVAGLEVYQSIATAYEAPLKVQLHSFDKSKFHRQGLALHEQLLSTVSTGKDTLAKDLNNGLVNRLLGLYLRRRIQRLSQVFKRVKVSDIVDLLGGSIDGKTGVKAYEIVFAELKQMDADRWLRPVVEEPTEANTPPSDAVIRFEEYEVDHTSIEATKRLTNVMQEAKAWNQAVDNKHWAVKSSEVYLTKQMNAANRAGFGYINADDFDDEAYL